MKYATLLLCFGVSALAQAPALTLEWRPDSVLITNHASSGVTAIIVAAFKREANNSARCWNQSDTIDSAPSHDWLAPGESREFTLSDNNLGVARDPSARRVLGALFADGSTFGDPEAVHFLQQSRRAIGARIPLIIARIQSMAAASESKSDMIRDLNADRAELVRTSNERFAAERAQRGGLSTGSFSDPDSPSVTFALQHTIRLIEHGPETVDIASIVQTLNDWRRRIEATTP